MRGARHRRPLLADSATVTAAVRAQAVTVAVTIAAAARGVADADTAAVVLVVGRATAAVANADTLGASALPVDAVFHRLFVRSPRPAARSRPTIERDTFVL